MIVAPGTMVLGCGWPCSPTSEMDGVANRRGRLPVIPSPPAVGGMECYGRSQAGSIKFRRSRHMGGDQTPGDHARWLRRMDAHADRVRQRT